MEDFGDRAILEEEFTNATTAATGIMLLGVTVICRICH